MQLDELESAQRADGSWGAQPTPSARIVSTIFAARSLQEAGLLARPALSRALDFLSRAALVDGAASIDGTRGSVLSCYTGMLARLFVRADRKRDALPLLHWIIRYQPVVFGEQSYLEPPRQEWGSYLRRRYGGCMSTSTTCLLGLVPAISALVAAREAGWSVDGQPHESAMRALLVDRRVMFSRSGEVLPLAGRTTKDPSGTRWILPAFPLDYVIDLIELVDLARRIDVPADAMRDAVEQLRSWRLRDGGWPMLTKRTLAHVYRPEDVNRRRRSEIITRRVEALSLSL